MLFGRVISVGIGYLCGMFLSGFLYGKKENVDLRKVGSGNVGTTNTMRNLGVKAGILTLIGDVCKVFMAMVIVWLIFRNRYPDSVKVLELYAGVGCILGHDFPAYMKFKGGKGIACTGGLLIGFCPLAVPISLGIFILVVAITRYVSLGSILGVISLEIQIIVFGQMGLLSVPEQYLTEVYIVFGFVAGLAIILHHANIGRLLKFSFHSKKQEEEERKKQMSDISIIGAGSWGTALSVVLHKNGHKITIWSALAPEIEMLKEKHEQAEKLPGVILPDDIMFTTDLKEAIEGKDMLVLAVPSPFTRSTAKAMSPFVAEGQLIVSVAKGIEENTLMTLSEIIMEEIPQCEVAVLCGPSHAEEVGKEIPTSLVAGAKKRATAELVQNTFMSEVLRVYTSPDVLGMEIGASLKNVIALAAGMADGLGYGDNTKAALITRGISEMGRLALAMGAKYETLSGLTGMGDLIVTCASKHSRNRRAGYLMGQGYTMQQAMDEVKMVVEGVYSAKAAIALAKKYHVDMPIIEQVNEVLFENKPAKDAVKELMLRDKKVEHDDLEWQ